MKEGDTLAIGLLVGLFVVFLALFIIAALAMKTGEKRAQLEEERLKEAQTKRGPSSSRNRRDGGGLQRMRAQANLRRRRRIGEDASDNEEDAAEYDDNEAESGGEEEEMDEFQGKKGRRKAEKKARAQQDREHFDARQKKQDAYLEKKRKKEAEREEKERLEEEQKAKEEEERQRKIEEEAAKWMDQISVDNVGSGEADVVQEDQGLLQRFVDYIKSQKTVLLEELAAEFGLKVQDAINRVTGLEMMGRISGVMDDRGKFIYISPEEMQAVADYLEERGRVSIAELASKSNEFIDLQTKEKEQTDLLWIDDEAKEDETKRQEEAKQEQLKEKELLQKNSNQEEMVAAA